MTKKTGKSQEELFDLVSIHDPRKWELAPNLRAFESEIRLAHLRAEATIQATRGIFVNVDALSGLNPSDPWPP